MSDTPAAYRREWDGDDSDLGEWVYVEEASERDHLGLWEALCSENEVRRLERERDEARAELTLLRESLDRLQATWAENAPAVMYKAERDEAREVLEELVEEFSMNPLDSFERDAIDRARAVLGKEAG